MIHAALCDIEGTTTALSFVHDVLFPISRDRMHSYIRDHWSEIYVLIKQIGNNPDDVAKILQSWIDEDRKEGVLKQIQGKIWKDAFESGAIRAHVYPDVRKNWARWKQRGIKIYIFSSGSVEAQKLLFGHTEEGDLTPLIDGYFDTTMGPKKDPVSYAKIASTVILKPEEIYFFSDVVEELDAARDAGMRTLLLNREGCDVVRASRPLSSADETSAPRSAHPVAMTFDSAAI
jgi:enolase-phosphatase E1